MDAEILETKKELFEGEVYTFFNYVLPYLNYSEIHNYLLPVESYLLISFCFRSYYSLFSVCHHFFHLNHFNFAFSIPFCVSNSTRLCNFGRINISYSEILLLKFHNQSTIYAICLVTNCI